MTIPISCKHFESKTHEINKMVRLIHTEQNLLADVRTADARVLFEGITSNEEYDPTHITAL